VVVIVSVVVMDVAFVSGIRSLIASVYESWVSEERQSLAEDYGYPKRSHARHVARLSELPPGLEGQVPRLAPVAI
jgi:hypothetical protein